MLRNTLVAVTDSGLVANLTRPRVDGAVADAAM